MPEAQGEDQEPGPEVLKGQRHGLGSTTVQTQHQHQQDTHGQPQEQGAASGPGPAGRWGRRGTRMSPCLQAPPHSEDWWGSLLPPPRARLTPMVGPFRVGPWGALHGPHGAWGTPTPAQGLCQCWVASLRKSLPLAVPGTRPRGRSKGE